MTMSFQKDETRITLQGNTQLSQKSINSSQLQKLIATNQIVYFFQFMAQMEISSTDTTNNKSLQDLLGRFPEIFATPS